MRGDVPVDSLILSKSLRNEYTGYYKQKRGDDGLVLWKKSLSHEYNEIHKRLARGKEGTPSWKANQARIKEIETEFRRNRSDLEQIQNPLVDPWEPPTIGHVVLAEKMYLRDPGSAPVAGERIPYAFIFNPDPEAKQGDRVEDPKWIKENNLRLDSLYYLNHQLKNPLLTIFGVEPLEGIETSGKRILERPDELFDRPLVRIANEDLDCRKKQYSKKKKEEKAIKRAKDEGIAPISNFFKVTPK